MLDTKLKKMRNLKVLIITLTVLLPATLLVALYPRMGQVYEQKVKELEAQENAVELEESIDDIISMESSPEEFPADAEYELGTNFVNYAMEAGYYLYGQIQQDISKRAVDFSVLDYYGWINDYYTLADQCDYYVEYQSISSNSAHSDINGRSQSEYDLSALLLEKQNAERNYVEKQLQADGKLGYLVLEFDEYGNISDVRFTGFGNIINVGSLYQHAKESVSQYENNVAYYNEIDGKKAKVNPLELQPKNFRAVFVVDEDSQFVIYRMAMITEQYQYQPHHIFSLMGVEWLLVAALVFVALVAFILPFFKKLNTGWEKIFSIPAEIICIIIACACGGVALMHEVMVNSCYPVLMETLELYGEINIIGYNVTPDTVYNIMLGVNFIGWAIVFFLEYISVSAVRQFLFRPLYYLKTRVLCVRICKWLWSLCKRAYHYVTEINIGKGLNKSIWKVVIVNALIIGVCCCFWFMGWIGVLIYSVILYVILRKSGFKLQSRYEAVLNATKEMAGGNLRTEVPTDLGVFSELGEELTKV